MDQVAIETAAVVVLADGSSQSDVANKRGHLFETFVAQLLLTQGYEEPRAENLNTTSEGVEIDVRARHRVTGDTVICECKAYSSSINAQHLTSFLGKFALARADDSQIRGLFIGLPRLTSNAREQAKSAEQKLPGFRYLGSYEVSRLLTDADILPDWDDGPRTKSDPTVVITEHGVVMAASDLDPSTRRAYQWVVWSRSENVPTAIMALIEKYLAQGLPVVSQGSNVAVIPARAQAAPSIVEVRGSSSDFEYQLPAAPQFFVGRKAIADALTASILTRDAAGSVVINAKSGWGKSSLALRLRKEVAKAGGLAVVVDARTAERPNYVLAVLERTVRSAADMHILQLPEDTAFSSLQSAIESVKRAQWSNARRPIYIAFDQFENVFRSPDLTREFRDLSLLVREVEGPLTIGFSWKTDLVGWTEGYPFRLRDEIRDVSSVYVLDPFGPREVETLLRRLEKSLGGKLNRELRGQLREYSQGLPWLFKKLGGHVLAEVQSGTSQEDLAKQALNIIGLFKSDLARLGPAEEAALRSIAHSAPVLVSDLDEGIMSNGLLDSLVHQRLVVQVGDRIDTYWDTFRDFLNTGTVAIEDSYVLRYAPLGAGRLLRIVVASNGRISVAEAASRLSTSVTVVLNYSRELKMFGVLKPETNQVVLDPDIQNSSDQEEAVRNRVATALRRHKMYKIATGVIEAEGTVQIQRFADLLPADFPTVEAKPDSWFTYARAFCQWMDYAGLVTLQRDNLQPRETEPGGMPVNLLSDAVPIRVRSVFPGGRPGPALELLQHLSDPSSVSRPPDRKMSIAIRDLALLGLLQQDVHGNVRLTSQEVVCQGVVDTKRLNELVRRQRGMTEAFARIADDPSVSPRDLGRAHSVAHGADWKDATTRSIGGCIRGWARICGIETKLRSAPKGKRSGATPEAELGPVCRTRHVCQPPARCGGVCRVSNSVGRSIPIRE